MAGPLGFLAGPARLHDMRLASQCATFQTRGSAYAWLATVLQRKPLSAMLALAHNLLRGNRLQGAANSGPPPLRGTLRLCCSSSWALCRTGVTTGGGECSGYRFLVSVVRVCCGSSWGSVLSASGFTPLQQARADGHTAHGPPPAARRHGIWNVFSTAAASATVTARRSGGAWQSA